MPLDEIKRGIEASARSEAKSMRDSAMSESRKILDEASERAKGIEGACEKEAASEIARMRREQAAEMERAARVSMLEAIDTSIRREYRGMQGKLASRLRKSEHYGRLFKEALKRAQDVAPASELVVQVNKKDERFVKNTGAQIEHANISGLVIYTKDRSVKIDATLNRLIDSSVEDAMTIIMSEIKKGRPPAREKAGTARRSAAKGRGAGAAAKVKKKAAGKATKKKR
jgi:vacuolar-type H+-ATPase subunit E/Vma4